VGDDVALRARFEDELRVAGLAPAERERELLFTMWVEHLPQREALRAAAPAPDEEPLP
jgi:AAA+ superfamily predicted ATPase